MKKYSKIGQLASLVKNITHSRQFVGMDESGEPIFDKLKPLGTVDLIGTVKIHGTNGGVRLNGSNGEITFQSRENIISPLKDNAGFAFYMDSIKEDLSDLFQTLIENVEQRDPHLVEKFKTHDFIIFGEWAGMGIQSNVAVSQLPKAFYIFDICLTSVGAAGIEPTVAVESDDDEGESDANAENPADSIYLDMTKYGDISLTDVKIYNLWCAARFPQYRITMDLENPKLIQNDIIAITDAVEECCPVGKFFGIEGIGEGVVYRTPLRELSCKVKGDKHAGKSKVKKTNIVDIEKLNSVNDFVEKYANDLERLEQGYAKMKELGFPYDKSTTGHFVRWMVNDVTSETQDVMIASGLEIKDVGGSISKIAQRWFINKIDEV